MSAHHHGGVLPPPLADAIRMQATELPDAMPSVRQQRRYQATLAALTGLCAAAPVNPQPIGSNAEALATRAVRIADAVLAELAKPEHSHARHR
jgi:hypothetical protein